MPLGELKRNSVDQSEYLKEKMRALENGDLEVKTVGDQAMLELMSEWRTLSALRDEVFEKVINDKQGSPLEICSLALEVGCYPPPWAIQALVETIQDYMSMAVNLKKDDGTGVPVDPSEIIRLESFLYYSITSGKTVIGQLRSMDGIYEHFCLVARFEVEFELKEKSSLKACVEKFLLDTSRNEDPDSFQRGLRIWAGKSESNKKSYERLRSLIAEKSRG